MNYRKAFIATLVIALGMAAALIYFGLRTRVPQTQSTPTTAAQQPASTAETPPQQPAQSEPNLSPVQLSPQRLQSIGVKFVEVNRQSVHDEIRVTGNVEVNEERLAYVQTRFPGWIQKVFADATYKYVRKGQPLFTIYSQDLVSTEQEFLLALRNRETLGRTQASGAAQEADWLLDAARQRLRQWNVPDSARADGVRQSGLAAEAGYVRQCGLGSSSRNAACDSGFRGVAVGHAPDCIC